MPRKKRKYTKSGLYSKKQKQPKKVRASKTPTGDLLVQLAHRTATRIHQVEPAMTAERAFRVFAEEIRREMSGERKD